MAARAISADTTCEPNLTPLLDLVLQILMFFMVTVNFTQEQNLGDVALPVSDSARPLQKKGDRDPIFLNLIYDKEKHEHQIMITGQRPMQQAQARNWILGQFEDLKRHEADGKVANPVIIRAHKDADYAQVYQLLRACSDAGFRNLKVRAIVN